MLTGRKNTRPLTRNPQNSCLPFDTSNPTNLYSAVDVSLAGISTTMAPQNPGMFVSPALLLQPTLLSCLLIILRPSSVYILSCSLFTYLQVRLQKSFQQRGNRLITFGKDDFLLAHNISELPTVFPTCCEGEREEKKPKTTQTKQPPKQPPPPQT